MNTLSKAFAIILAILLLYMYPMSEAYNKQDDISYTVALQAVTNFVDAVRNKGYMTPTMYNDFFNQLESTGNTYDIEMEHDHKKYDPVYTDPTNPSTFQHQYNVDYDSFYNRQIMSVLFPNTSQPLNDPAREYKLSVGDYFSVTVKNTNRTNATILRDFLNNSSSDNTSIDIPYGGMVENEDY